MPGPESLLERSPEVADRFFELIRDGVPRAHAALGCGFSYDTLYGWVRQGLVPGAREPYASFARKLYETEVELLRGWIQEVAGKGKPSVFVDEDGSRYVMEAGKVDARALTWLLERRFPTAFGRAPTVYDDPAEDVAKELRQAATSTVQLEAGGDGGQLDTERWELVREWFSAAPARLLELARETGLAEAALAEAVTEKEGDES